MNSPRRTPPAQLPSPTTHPKTPKGGVSSAPLPKRAAARRPGHIGRRGTRLHCGRLQASQLIPPQPGHEYDTSFFKHEFFFEKLQDAA
ncbi:hypothetical protein [Streptomyces sp. NBC_01210]|uniref:hypothetical protein n=1 Tax=Streptomyces sp. NBC_01210 TaxID=2903774 RepID=UPI003FA3D758